jgi:hypothetical protein
MLKDLILEDCEFRVGSSIQIFMSLLDFPRSDMALLFESAILWR